MTAVRDRMGRIDRAAVMPVAVVVAVFLLCVGMFGTSTVTQDGMVYYAESRSAVFDRDFDLGDEYAQDWSAFSAGRVPFILQSLPRDEDGRFEQVANSGAMVMLGPAILTSVVATATLQALGVDVSNTGFGQLQFAWAVLWACGLVLASLIILHRFLASRIGGWAATGAVLFGLFGGTMALWTLVFGMHTHELALPVTTVIVVLSLARLRSGGPGTYLALGLLLGFVVSIRPVAGLYGVVPAAWLVIRFGAPWLDGLRASPRRWPDLRALAVPVRDGVILFVAFLAGHLPALLIADDAGLFGSAYYDDTGYLTRYLLGNVPRGLIELVLDPAQGQLWWVPISVVALVGIVPAIRRDRFVGLSLLLWTVAIYVFVASLGGQAMFGSPNRESRHLSDLTPVIIIALGYLLAWPRRAVVRWISVAVLAGLAGYGLVLKVSQIAGFRPPGLSTVMTTLGDPSFLVDQVGPLWKTMVLGPVVDGLRQLDAGTIAFGLASAVLALVVVAVIAPIAWRVAGMLDERAAGTGPDADPAAPDPDPAAPRPAIPTRRPLVLVAVVAWACAIALTMAGPVGTLLDPPDQRRDDGAALDTTTLGGDPMTVDGPVDRVVLGSSPNGAASVDRPLPAALPEPAIVRPATGGSVAITSAGASFTVSAPATGTLVALSVPVLAIGQADVLVEARSAAGATLASTLVPGGDTAAWTVVPLATGPVPPGDDLVIHFSSAGNGPQFAAAADGGPAAALYAAEDIPWPGIEVTSAGATTSLMESGTIAPYPAQMVLAPTGDVVRLGPYPADLLLAWSSSHDGWSLGLPRNAAAGGWRVSAQATTDEPLVLPIRMAASIRSVRLTLLTTSGGRQPTRTSVGLARPGEEPDEVVEIAIPTTSATATEFEFEVGQVRDVDLHIVMDPAIVRTTLNVAWVDVALEPAAAAAQAWASAPATYQAVGGDPNSAPPVQVVTVVEPSTGQRVGDALVSISDAARQAWLVVVAAAVMALAAALVSYRRRWSGGPAPLAWLAAAGLLVTLGILGIPRATLVPASPPFAQGSGTDVVVTPFRVTPTDAATTAGSASYVAPPIAIPAGGTEVSLDWSTTGSSQVSIATSADGRMRGDWHDVPSPDRPVALDLPAAERFIHVRFTFDDAASDLSGLVVRYRP